ncbi:UTRA domain-containing protein [Vibrio sp.]|nr:UTRA domain-containing protein [Vibrio sp.]
MTLQYLAIQDAILSQIASGSLSEGQKLPSERSLAESFSTTRITLREALSSLEIEGHIFREDRRGWFVAPSALQYDPNNVHSFNQMAISQGHTPKIEVISSHEQLANTEVTHLLSLPAFSKIYAVEQLRYLNDRPVVVVKNHVPVDRAPRLLGEDLTQSLTDIYQNKYHIIYSKTQYKVSFTSLSGHAALLLRATPGSPAVRIERVNYDKHDRIIDCDIELWRHDAISIQSMATLTSVDECL